MGKRHEQKIYDELAVRYLIDGDSLTKLAEESGIGRQALSTNFKRMGISIINNQNKVKFNENIFDEIDSEEKAYWLGFIFADGYIAYQKEKPNYGFELSLQLSDIEHLKKFSNFIGYSNLVKADTYRARCCFKNKHFWNTLNFYGCTPRKSLTLEFPKEEIFKKQSLIKDFIRGYFDGDGCITYQKNKFNEVFVVCSILGTPKFLDILEYYLQFDDKITRCQDKRLTENTTSLSFKRFESLFLINYLYSNSIIYLDRKYKLYSFFKNGCRSLEEFNELLLGNIGEGCEVNTEINN